MDRTWTWERVGLGEGGGVWLGKRVGYFNWAEALWSQAQTQARPGLQVKHALPKDYPVDILINFLIQSQSLS